MQIEAVFLFIIIFLFSLIYVRFYFLIGWVYIYLCLWDIFIIVILISGKCLILFFMCYFIFIDVIVWIFFSSFINFFSCFFMIHTFGTHMPVLITTH